MFGSFVVILAVCSALLIVSVVGACLSAGHPAE